MGLELDSNTSEHSDLMECRELMTLGNLVRAPAEILRVTPGWAAVPVEMTDRAARRANRDWRAFVIECLDPVEGWRRVPGGGTGADGKSVARS